MSWLVVVALPPIGPTLHFGVPVEAAAIAIKPISAIVPVSTVSFEAVPVVTVNAKTTLPISVCVEAAVPITVTTKIAVAVAVPAVLIPVEAARRPRLRHRWS